MELTGTPDFGHVSQTNGLLYDIDRGALACSSFIFIGAVISAAGSNAASFRLVLAGRIVLGFGSIVIESCIMKVCLSP